jgi:menaquinone-dependent protoporphyrinogen IX oxidase
MKILPQKKWKKALLVTLIVFLIVGVPIVSFLEYSVYKETATPIEVKNAGGNKTALVIYHPGLTAFSHDIAYTFADRLASNGWRVEITTASSQAPANITKYELIVLDWPIYDFNPGPTLTNYVHRIGDLQNKDTVIITIGGGINPFNAQDAMKQIVQEVNGNLKDLVAIFRGGNFTEKADQAASTIIP